MKTLRYQVAAVVAALSTGALAGDFVDTRIAVAFANDNLLVKPGETTPNSPGTGFGAAKQNTQFYDNVNTRYSGFETLSNLALYKRAPSFFEGVDTESALSVLVLDNASGSVTLVDNSSYLKVNYRPAGWGAKEEVALTGFPVSSDRFRLGYAWKMSWGGDTAFTLNQGTGLSSTGRPNAVPGAKLQVTRDRWYAFAGLKTGLLTNNLTKVQERQYGVLAGAGAEIIPAMAKIEANGGYFQRGIAPSLADSGIRAPVNAMGGSANLSFYKGEGVQQSLDMRLMKNDPDATQKLFRPETYNGGVSFTVSLEGSLLGQTLINPDKFAATKTQYANALLLQARFKVDYWRVWGLGLARSFSFIQFDVPGFPPYNDFSKGTTVRPETWFAIGADRYLPAYHLTAGLVAGVQVPASVSAPRLSLGGNNPPPGEEGPRTVVIRDVNLIAILPGNVAVLPIFSIKGTAKIDLSEYFALVGEVFYTRDDNRVTFRDSTALIAQPSFEKPDQLGFNAVMQARF